ncbi:MAG: DUF908 domain-containing protein [Cyanosarcina radialis HA8281-LM2]|jgi:hypothetical protein|nr:DUF908 domain-containing protein [Cyanosarcina radialis HA8281-LM2]
MTPKLKAAIAAIQPLSATERQQLLQILIQSHPDEEFLQRVLQQEKALTVQLPTGETVLVKPQPLLPPLPVLSGSIPKGWKDAI